MPDDGQLAARSYLGIRQKTVQIIDTRNRLVIESHDDIALAQTRNSRRTSLLGAHHHHAAFFCEAIEPYHSPMDGYGLR